MEKKEYIERGLAVQLLRECTQMQGKEIEKECDTPILRNVLNVYYLAREGATTLLEDIPAADVVEVVHGEWEIVSESYRLFDDYDEAYFVKCPFCDRIYYVPFEFEEEKMIAYAREHYPYCHCGAKMDGGNRNADA